jgi:hypothetical protein
MRLNYIVNACLIGIILVTVANAIEWRDTLDQVNGNIQDANVAGDIGRMHAIDTMKEVEQQRAIAEQLERVAKSLERHEQIARRRNDQLTNLQGLSRTIIRILIQRTR